MTAFGQGGYCDAVSPVRYIRRCLAKQRVTLVDLHRASRLCRAAYLGRVVIGRTRHIYQRDTGRHRVPHSNRPGGRGLVPGGIGRTIGQRVGARGSHCHRATGRDSQDFVVKNIGHTDTGIRVGRAPLMGNRCNACNYHYRWCLVQHGDSHIHRG